MKIFQDLATVANCESLGEANKIHLSQAIFDHLKNSKFDNGSQKFELEEDTNKVSSKRFVIRWVEIFMKIFFLIFYYQRNISKDSFRDFSTLVKSERLFQRGSEQERRVTSVLGQE